MKKNHSRKLLVWFFVAALFTMFIQSNDVLGKTFTSQFTEFELPNGWDCLLEGSGWVCQSENKERKKEAIIILAAKIRSEEDSLDQYQAYLKEPKTFTLPGGRSQVSEPKSITVKKINNQQWVDALHLASEVPGYYTRYLVTVKDNLGIAVTFSVAKDHYDLYQEIFDKIIVTLKVFDQENVGEFQLKSKTAEEVEVGQNIIDADLPKNDIGTQKKEKSSGGLGEDNLLYVLIFAAIGIFIFIKMKKKK